MRPVGRTAIGLLALAAAAQAAQVTIPDEATLERILWEVPRVTGIPEAKVADLKRELERVVAETLDGAPWAPLHVIPGRGEVMSFFHDPSETFYALALACPYVPPAAQQKLKAFLATERQTLDPLTGHYPLDKGRRREHYILGPKARSILGKGSYHYRPVPPQARLYRLWAYHYYTGTPLDAATWAKYRRCLGQPCPPTLMYWYASANDDLACRIALARLAYMAGDGDATRLATREALEAMKARLRFEEGNRPVVGGPRERAWHGYHSRGGIFIVRSGNNRAWIPRWRHLTPEIGRLLALGAKGDVAEQDRYIAITRPAGHLAWGPKQFEGEVATNQPHQAMSIFQAKAYVLRRPVEELRYYADIPWCPADLYYIEKLVCVLRAHGRLTWRDTRGD